MKTIDLLVQALPAIGGWPEKVTHIGQDYDRELMFYGRGNVRTGIILDQLAVDHRKYGETGVKITREQYEAALAAKNDGWIEWGGGKCPVQTGVLVDVRYGDGVEEFALEANMPNKTRFRTAAAAWWRHDGHEGDIIAYRLHQPQQEEQSEASEEDLNECIGQAPVTQWNGEGLPPVGMEIEYKFAKANYRTDFSRGKVLGYGMHNVFMEHWASKNEFIQPLDKIEFRHIRSEADKKRDAMVNDMVETIFYYYGNPKGAEGYIGLAERIIKAIEIGKIPGVKLEG